MKSDTTKGVPGTEATDVGMEEKEEELMKEDGPRVISDTMKVKDVPGTDAALNPNQAAHVTPTLTLFEHACLCVYA